jgi:hypothetical protein
MPAPYRIVNPAVGVKAAAAPQTDFSSYLDRLMKMVPTEVIGLYLVGSGIIPHDQPVVLTLWALICLVGVVAMRAWGTADATASPPQPTDWTHVAISAVAFILWIFTMGGGPFTTGGVFAAAYEQTPYVGSLLVLAWTFFVPIFYKGAAS